MISAAGFQMIWRLKKVALSSWIFLSLSIYDLRMSESTLLNFICLLFSLSKLFG